MEKKISLLLIFKSNKNKVNKNKELKIIKYANLILLFYKKKIIYIQDLKILIYPIMYVKNFACLKIQLLCW